MAISKRHQKILENMHAPEYQIVLEAIVKGFTTDPGTSDLDNEQPVHITIPLGEYRRAVRLLHELEKA
jgi:hypothetical protein